MTKEIWKDVPGYEGLYQVSNQGRVKSLDRLDRRGWKIKERILKGGNVRGYRSHVLTDRDGKLKGYKVSTLVAMAFLGHVPCGFKIVVDHKNNNRTDDRLINLQLLTNRANVSKDVTGISTYTGVFKDKSSKKWRSALWVINKQIYLGTFDTEEEAAEYYRNAVKCVEDGRIEDIVIKKQKYASKYTGVTYRKDKNVWRARIGINYKQITIGDFYTEEEAYQARKDYEKQLEKNQII